MSGEEVAVLSPELPEGGATSQAGQFARSGAPAQGARPARSQLTRALAWLRPRLARSDARTVIIAANLLFSLPVLWLQLDADDHFQVASIEQNPTLRGVARAPWDLYSYANERASNLALRDQSIWPWWSDPDVMVKFFRPLTSLTRWLDHQLWPEHLPLMQLQSLLWYAALLWLVSRLYQRLIPAPWLAALALGMFAFDEARAHTIGWLCNRNGLIALVFGFAALHAHERWRSTGDRRAAWLSPLWLALGFAGGEAALQIVGYLVAYALFVDRGSRAARLASLLPSLAVVGAWAALYKLLGYGATGSDIYVDPIREPGAFASFLPERLLTYDMALFHGISADWNNLLPLLGIAPRPILLPLALASAVLVFAAFRPLFRRDARVRFWAVGALLSTLPVCGVTASDRMLTGAALGGMALIAILLGALYEQTYPRRSRWIGAYGWLLAAANLVMAPLLRPGLIAVVDDFEEVMAHADASIPAGPEIRAETLVLLNPPFDTFGIFFPLYRETHRIPRPARFHWLAAGVSELRVQRIDDRTLQITPADGFLVNSTQLMLRSLSKPLPVGEKIALTGISYEVASHTEDGRPRDVIVRFDRSLESESFRFLQWGKHEYVPFVPPAVGQAVTVPAVDMMTALTSPG